LCAVVGCFTTNFYKFFSIFLFFVLLFVRGIFHCLNFFEVSMSYFEDFNRFERAVLKQSLLDSRKVLRRWVKSEEVPAIRESYEAHLACVVSLLTKIRSEIPNLNELELEL